MKNCIFSNTKGEGMYWFFSVFSTALYICWKTLYIYRGNFFLYYHVCLVGHISYKTFPTVLDVGGKLDFIEIYVSHNNCILLSAASSPKYSPGFGISYTTGWLVGSFVRHITRIWKCIVNVRVQREHVTPVTFFLQQYFTFCVTLHITVDISRIFLSFVIKTENMAAMVKTRRCLNIFDKIHSYSAATMLEKENMLLICCLSEVINTIKSREG